MTMKSWCMDMKVDAKTVICFDLDDTLYNEIDFLKSAYKEIAKHIVDEKWEFLYAKMLSLYRKSENVFEFLTSNYPISIDILLNIYRNHIPKIEPFKGVFSLLNAIKKANGSICIITDGRSLTQRNKLKALGIIDLFDTIIISEEIGTEKPNINNYKTIEDKFPNCTYTYIADNFKKDFIIPNQRYWNSIGIIDNGLNIHNNCFDYQSKKNIPKQLVAKIDCIQIVK